MDKKISGRGQNLKPGFAIRVVLAPANAIDASLKFKGLKPPGGSEAQCRPTGAQKRRGVGEG